MEDVLDIYHLPYNEQRPVICLDELPFQLLGEKVEPLPIKEGSRKSLKNGRQPKLLSKSKII